MFILDVIPLTYLPKEESQILSYFISEKMEKGSLITIPLKKRETLAIVFDCHKVKEAKLSLKEASFSLKPISKIIKNGEWFPNYFFNFSKWLSDFYLTSLSFSFSLFFPKGIEEIFIQKKEKRKKSEKEVENLYSKIARIESIEKIIKEIKKEKGQILIVVPNQTTGEIIFSYLKEKFKKIFLWQSNRKKEILSLWEKTYNQEAKIVIGSQRAIFLPFANLKLIIIFESDNSLHKNKETRPFLDNRELSKKLSELTKAKLLMLFLEKDKIFKEETKKTKLFFIDLKKEGWPPFLAEEIEEEIEKSNENWLIFTNRKGYARYLICKDCFRTINCPNCSTPLTVHKTEKGEKYLFCHHCGYRGKIPDLCPYCQGYLLEERGIGSQRIYEKLPENSSKVIFDTEHIKNLKEEKKAIKEILKGKYRFVIATELFLKWFLHFEKFFKKTLITSIESLLSFPYFDTSERFFFQLEKLRFISKEIFIQTFDKESQILKKLSGENFLEEEKKLRERFGLPLPSLFRFEKQIRSKIIKLKVEKKSAEIARQQAYLLSKILKNKGLSIIGPTPSFIYKKKGLFSYELIVKIKNENEKKIIKEILPSKNWQVDVY